MSVVAPVETSRHGVYFYQRSDYLTQRVHDFVCEGLALGETVVVVATEEHRQVVRRVLADGPAAHVSAYLDVDVANCLARFCTGGVLDKPRFLDAVTPFFTQVQDLGRPIRLYGEGVTVLWEQGFRQAAIELEGWWNELIRQYRFSSILCGYAAGGQTTDDLMDVLAVHTHVCLGAAIRRNG
jgi:hypothetical protein